MLKHKVELSIKTHRSRKEIIKVLENNMRGTILKQDFDGELLNYLDCVKSQ